MHTLRFSAALGQLAASTVIVATLLFLSPAHAYAQRPDSTKQMPGMPGMKMPTAKPAPAQTKTKAKPTSAKAPKKTPAKSATIKKPTSDTTRRTMPDTMHMRMADSTARRDTVHAMPDTMHMQMRDTSHKQMPDTMHMQKRDTNHAPMPDTMHMAAHDTMSMTNGDTMAMAMSMTGPLGVSMERMGSGTTWTPDAVMLPSRHLTWGSWTVMVHGFVFGEYDRQSGRRGSHQFGGVNWGMIMAEHDAAGGRLQFRFMPSLDAATVGKCGYPLLLQTGETCNGQPLVDRQHPHDFFMELGALFERAITSSIAGILYAAPAGEPALGPVAFMHRPSAMDIPFAPLGHHWQDATHISFGVVTTGIYTRTIRLEVSAFNGIDPDENRWDFDPIKINSYSARLTLNPDSSWSFTGGYGAIAQPQAGNPSALTHRLVGSAMYGRRLSDDAQWATTFIYGANKEQSWSGSALLESEAVLDRRNTVFARVELVQKSGADLSLRAVPAERLFNTGTASLGYIREFARGQGVTLGVGASGTVNVVPSALESTYGSRTPLGAMVFVRLRPYHSKHNDFTGMGGMSTHHDQ